MQNAILERVQHINHTIEQLQAQSEQVAKSIIVLGVSKGQSCQKIKEALAAGIQHLGENYVQEAKKKMDELKEYPIFWHFIGSIQKNKCKEIASRFNWVHSVSQVEEAQLLSHYRHPDLPLLNICIQVNWYESTKSGVLPEKVTELAQAIMGLPRIKLRGLMIIPPQGAGVKPFNELHRLKNDLNRTLSLKLDMLSMGMSDDYKAALLAGSTVIRIGRGIFGARYEN